MNDACVYREKGRERERKREGEGGGETNDRIVHVH